MNEPRSNRSESRWGGGRRGYVLIMSLAVMVVVLMAAFATQAVALRDLQFASRSLTRTYAYLNARSGIEAAIGGLEASSADPVRIDPNAPMALNRGGYRVDVELTDASAFSPLLADLDPRMPIYLIESVGWVPIRGGAKTYELKQVALVRLVSGRAKVLVWSENPGAPKKSI